ncbi:glycoside hydrolase superfamily [Phlyctochytrium arcticum]|nr:glycoside hydrolase superfamily [Phlyctochytrium arcticum]
MKISTILAAVASTLAITVQARSAQEWRTRSVYQIMTDRFAVSNESPNPGACDGERRNDYCGGTWKGIQDKLPYIKDLGFNAIWISPTVKNTPGGYHGYWAFDFYKSNEKFGTDQDLKDLIEEAHKQDVWVMVDVVTNHVGMNDDLINSPPPFNKYPEHYHVPFDRITDRDYNTNDEWAIQNKCLYDTRLNKYLPDLNTENPEVQQAFQEWIRWFIKEFNVDGLRIDTVKHVKRPFWQPFVQAAGVYAVGEAFIFDADVLAGWKDTMDGLFNFPLFNLCQKVFGQKQSMWEVENYLREVRQLFGQDQLHLMGNFIDNHDLPRFLYTQPDRAQLRNAVALALFSDGIPYIYQGTEQEYAGGPDPQNREPLWYVPYNGNGTSTSSVMSIWNKARTNAGTDFSNTVHSPVWTEDNFHLFKRGPFLVALTNAGSRGPQVQKTVPASFPAGTSK